MNIQHDSVDCDSFVKFVILVRKHIVFFVQQRLLGFSFSKVSYFESSVSSLSRNEDLTRKKLSHCSPHSVQRSVRISLSGRYTHYIQVSNKIRRCPQSKVHLVISFS